MKAFGIINQAGSITEIQIATKQPTGYDLLVEIKAVSVNPVDTKVRYSKSGLTDNQKIMGYDASGVVVKIGEKASLFQVGDEVFYAGAINRPGTNMAFHLVDERIVGKKPATLSFADAASLPLTSITAYEGLFKQLPFRFEQPEQNKGKTVLIINGAGGVGSIAIQLAKLAGLTVIATASRPETVQWVKKMGADVVINHHQKFADELVKLGIQSVDAIFCLNATTTHWQNMADVIKPFGHICSIVELGKDIALDLLKNKSVTFSWEFMFTRSLYQTPDIIEQHHILNKIAQLAEAQKLHLTTTETLTPINADNLWRAHQQIEAGQTIGKIVVTN